MNGIHRKIKELRSGKEITQPEMADKLGMSLKTYQNFENGITKLDYERLKAVAELLEVTVEDLINAEDSGVFIAEIKHNSVGYNGSKVVIKNTGSESEKELYEKIIAEKDERIKLLTSINEKYERLIEMLQKKE